MKKLYMGTNLKMYKNIAQTTAYLDVLQEATADISRDELCLFVIPSFTTLQSAMDAVKDNLVLLGAQNMHWEEEGQFTGEISPSMLKELGIHIIEIGHSERRHTFGETDENCNRKVLSALAHGFMPLLCIGETGEQKNNGISDEILRIQLKIGLKGVSPDNVAKVWIAYEPVWAIGVSGVPASPKYAEEKHFVIKAVLKEMYGARAEEIPVLYGGSVNPENYLELLKMKSIDGLFIGRSAWEGEAFGKLIHNALACWKNCR